MVYEVYNDDYLAHHGIDGMKWGIRRFQNPDGTLTAAGRERYRKNALEKLDTRTRKILNNPFHLNQLGERRQKKLEEKSAKAKSEGNEKRAAKLTKKAEAQAAANDNRNAWDKRQSTGKLATATGYRTLGSVVGSIGKVPNNPQAWISAIEQVMNGTVSSGALSELTNLSTVFNPLIFATSVVANNAVHMPNYRHARARGSGIVRSFLETNAGLTPVSSILRYAGDKKAYGALTRWS